jgi:hypothetical protein
MHIRMCIDVHHELMSWPHRSLPITLLVVSALRESVAEPHRYISLGKYKWIYGNHDNYERERKTINKMAGHSDDGDVYAEV